MRCRACRIGSREGHRGPVLRCSRWGEKRSSGLTAEDIDVVRHGAAIASPHRGRLTRSRSFARARTGSTRTDAAVSARPTKERSGAAWPLTAAIAIAVTYTPIRIGIAPTALAGSPLETDEVMLGRALTTEAPDEHPGCAAVGDRVSDERDRSCREPGDDRADPYNRGPGNGQAAPPNRLGDLGVGLAIAGFRACRDQPRALRVNRRRVSLTPLPRHVERFARGGRIASGNGVCPEASCSEKMSVPARD